MRTLTPQELQERFPKLRPGNWERRSLADPRYNCLAFANGDARRLWDPFQYGGKYFWPQDIDRDVNAETWEKIFLNEGFERTENRDVEKGFEKVAIYVSLEDMCATHVAISNGSEWLSKLGKGQDIMHSSLDLLEGTDGDEYGLVDRILRRRAPKE